MADTQTAPDIPQQDGSLNDATNALLGLLNPDEDTPVPEQATEETEEVSEEPSEEESQEATSEQEAEEEASDDDSEEEVEEPTEEQEEEPLYAVKVDGIEQEVTLDELLSGYSRQSSYTKRSQQLAEQRKELENAQGQMANEYQQIQAERQHYVNSLQQVINNSTSGLDKFQQINWEQLKADDPLEYTVRREEYREAQDKIRGLQQQQADAQARVQADFQKQRAETLQTEHAKMIEALPEWGDAQKQQEVASQIRTYAMKQGFQKEELDSLVDSRSLLVLRKAMLYDNLQTADVKSKKLKNKPRVIRSGKGVEKKQTAKKVRDAKMKRLQSTGHINDATAVLEELLTQ